MNRVPPFLIALPGGLSASGVVAWALRVCNGLVARGGRAGIVVHAPPGGQAELAWEIDPRVRVWDLRDLCRIEDRPGDVGAFVPRYREAIEALARGQSEPVIFSPNLVGDCYAIAAALSQVIPSQMRVVGWLHNDIPYEYHVQRHYARLISAFVPVSGRIEETLRAQLGAERRGDVRRIAYGVEVPAEIARGECGGRRPLRVVYSGRLEETQKRVMCLPELSRELTRGGLAHELVVLGDGPAAGELARASADVPSIRLCGGIGAAGVREVLAQADVLVLPSRHEGLSVAVMEAMALGCVPVITRVASGASELVEDGVSGVLVDEPREGEALGGAMARGVQRAALELAAMSPEAWRRARAEFSLLAHLERVCDLLTHVAGQPARSWPTNRPCGFAGAGGAGSSGSVPADGAARLEALLKALSGRRLFIHGTGRHTLELAEVYARFGSSIVGFIDDDPAKHGTTLWGWRVLSPQEATDGTDVVISSWINQGVIFARRGVYEALGLVVHALYEPESSARAPLPGRGATPQTPAWVSSAELA